MSKEKITRNEYTQVVGLMHMANQHNKKMNEYIEAIKELLKDEDGEWIWEHVLEDGEVDKMLEKMQIKVAK